jgi:cellulose synthase/poly-beta-1,6-N-acetylglucosamine synthase-like glycosyltransferase
LSEVLFWLAAALLAYTYLGFPVLLFMRAHARTRRVLEDDVTPRLSMVICAHDEAGGIDAKIRNVLACDYPCEKLEIVIASDGSTDGTNEIVAAHAERGVRLLALPRRGKIPTLNDAVAAASGEVLVFSDANSMYAPDALRRLVRPLADPLVGGVAGDQRYERAAECGASADGERAYWSLDRMLKRWQSAAGSATSATGAIYAIRASLFQPVPPGVTDDFVISTRVVAAGSRLVFRPDAAAYEPVAPASDAEFRRKVRVITRGLRGIWEMRMLLDPRRYGFYALQLLSHKVLRRLAVFPLLVLFAASLALWNESALYRAAAVAQLALYGAGALVALLDARTRTRLPKIASLPFYFCLVNTASLLAVANVVRGRRIDQWSPRGRGKMRVTPADEGARP